MADVLELPFLATNGRIPAAVWERLGETVSSLTGKRLIITLKEQKRKRSLNQNAYMWGVVITRITDAFRHAGNNVDSDDVFSFLKGRLES